MYYSFLETACLNFDQIKVYFFTVKKKHSLGHIETPLLKKGNEQPKRNLLFILVSCAICKLQN